MVVRILTIGLLIGLLDGLAAVANAYFSFGIWPERVFAFIAGGLHGREAAAAGGSALVLQGVLLHLFIAVTVTAVFFLLYFYVLKSPKNYLLVGAVYGVVVWLVMNRVVIPLSALGPGSPSARQVVTGLLIHIFVIGIPLAWFASRTRPPAGRASDANLP